LVKKGGFKMAVSHSFKATNLSLSTTGGASLGGDLTLNGATTVNVLVDIRAPSSPGNSEAVIFGPLNNARVAIETPAFENTLIALRAGTKVSIHFESTAPIPDSLSGGQKFSSFRFSISRKLES
jgi:hypothetical protein